MNLQMNAENRIALEQVQRMLGEVLQFGSVCSCCCGHITSCPHHPGKNHSVLNAVLLCFVGWCCGTVAVSYGHRCSKCCNR